MKILIKYFILINFFSNYIFAQYNTTGGILELYLNTMNSTGNTLTVRLETRSTIWEENHSLTNDPNFKYSDQTVVGNYTGYLIGWHFISSIDVGNPVFGFGFYKVSNSLNNSVFYIDYRDCEWSVENSVPYSGRTCDLYLRYDGSAGMFSYKDEQGNYVLINSGDELRIWEIKQKIPPINVTNGFQNYSTNNLRVYSINNNPTLIWETNPDYQNITGYQMCRAYTPENDPANETDFQEIANVTSANLNFNDQAVTELETNNLTDHSTITYKIKAFNGSNYLYSSNQVSVHGYTDWSKTLICTSVNNHPKLIWAKFTDNIGNSTVYSYNIYKRRSGGSYTLIGTASSTVTSFTDGSEFLYSIGNTKTYVSYYVTAIYDHVPQESIPSNSVSKAVNEWMNKSVGQEDKKLENDFSFSLAQNHPNPFNPSTQISYQIPANSFVTLRVYDVLGNEIAVLVNEWKEPGSYNAQFTISGKQLASGMYFYKIEAGSFNQTKKLILMK